MVWAWVVTARGRAVGFVFFFFVAAGGTGRAENVLQHEPASHGAGAVPGPAASRQCEAMPLGDPTVLKLPPQDTHLVETREGAEFFSIDRARGELLVIEPATGVSRTVKLKPPPPVSAPPYLGYEFRAQLSRDGKKVLLPDGEGGALVVDTLTGESTGVGTRGPLGRLTGARISPDGRLLAYSDRGLYGEIVIRDLVSGKEQRLSDRTYDPMAFDFTPDGAAVLGVFQSGAIKRLEIESGNDTTLEEAKGRRIRGAAIDPFSGQVARVQEDGALVTVETPGKGDARAFRFGEPGHASPDRPAKGWATVIVSKLIFSPGGKFLILDSGMQTEVRDTVSGKRAAATGTTFDPEPHFTPDGNAVTAGAVTARRSADGSFVVSDHPVRDVVESFEDARGLSGIRRGWDGHRYFFHWKPDSTCFRNELSVAPRGTETAAPRRGRREAPDVSDLCGLPYDEAKWDAKVARSASDDYVLSRAEARNFLLRFQRRRAGGASGFDPKRHPEHLAVLLAILRSDLAKEEPALVAGALQNVAYVSELLYERVLAMPTVQALVRDLDIGPGTTIPCRGDEERELFQKAASFHLAHVLSRNATPAGLAPTSLSTWLGLKPFVAELARLPAEEREKRKMDIWMSVRDGAARFFPEIWESRLAYAVKPAVMALFGEAAPPYTDVSTTLGGETVYASVVSSRPIELETPPAPHDSPGGREPNRFGFYRAQTRTLDLSPEQTRATGTTAEPIPPGTPRPLKPAKAEIVWKTDGRRLKATLDARPVEDPRRHVPASSEPDYEALWKSPDPRFPRQIVGLVVIGSNVNGKEAEASAASYLDFYARRGYRPSSEFPDRPISDFRAELERQVASDFLRYLPKDAHSGGDDNHILSVHQKGALKTLVKVGPDGSREIAQVFVADRSSAVVRIPNDEFASWVAKRKLELTYFNGSCHSSHKAIRECAAGECPQLRNVCSPTPVHGLYDGGQYGTLLDAYLARQPTSRWAERLEACKKELSASGRDEAYDEWIWPGTEAYRRCVTEKLIHIAVKTFEEQGGAFVPLARE